jgi:hypothetical protein
MAFCRFCGKQIPDGGVCDCAAAQAKAKEENQVANVQESTEQAVESVKETASEVNNEAVQTAENVQETASQVNESSSNGYKQLSGADIAKKVDGIASDISENLPGSMKNNKNAVYIAGCVVAVIILILLMCLFGGGPKSAVKNYIKASSSKRGGKTYYSYTLPKVVIKELKKEDDYDDLIDDFKDRVEDTEDELEGKETMPKFDKIVKMEKLKRSDLNNAENYFELLCQIYDADDDDIEISKGYEIKVKLKNKDEDGDIERTKRMICVVKIKGDGWKIIPKSKDSLENYD